MNYLGMILGKLISKVGKILNRGSSLPGYVALRISPNLLKKVKYPKEVVVVTGTNGKTSTANMIADILTKSGKKVIYNRKGANLLSGLYTTIINGIGFDFKIKGDVLLLEIDESTIPKFFESVIPTYFIINNFFRDQLDRHGEIDTLIRKIENSIDISTTLILNGNDPLVHLIGNNLKKNKKVYFGIDKTKDSFTESEETREAKWCPICDEVLKYEFYHYSQIGKYYCQCGFSTPALNYIGNDVNFEEKSFKVNDEYYKSNYDNLYFIFNTLGAISLVKELKINYDVIKEALLEFQIGEGRMEKIRFGEYDTFLNLVKNPSGLDQSLSYIFKKEDRSFSIIFAINNLYADGIDTSWIWDVSFEILKDAPIEKFICSGKRAYDLAVRLKYAGIPVEKIQVIQDIENSIKYAKERLNSKVYMLSSYTMLQEFRKVLYSLPENKKER